MHGDSGKVVSVEKLRELVESWREPDQYSRQTIEHVLATMAAKIACADDLEELLR